jgi:RNA polymerase sigma factor (sigma-70 family)
MLPPYDNNPARYGFQDELEALYQDNKEMVLQAAYRMILNKEDAADILQIVFQRLVENPELQKGFRDNPQGYLYRAAINEALNMYKAHRREAWADEDISQFEMPAPDREDVHLVRAAMERLKPDDREVLYLFYFEGLECSAIAAMRGKSTNAVFLHLWKARRAMKKAIRNEEKQNEAQKEKHERDRGSDYPAAFKA